MLPKMLKSEPSPLEPLVCCRLPSAIRPSQLSITYMQLLLASLAHATLTSIVKGPLFPALV